MEEAACGEKSSTFRRGLLMAIALSPNQETEAKELAQAIATAAQEELLEIARTLVGSSPATLFGNNEFKIRDIILRVAAKAYEQRLAQKKTATKEPA
jgi:hypothetical protein